MEINFRWCSVRLSLLGCHSLSRAFDEWGIVATLKNMKKDKRLLALMVYSLFCIVGALNSEYVLLWCSDGLQPFSSSEI